MWESDRKKDGSSTATSVSYTHLNVDKFVEVMFRVNNVYKDMEICVMSGDQKLAGFKREHMAPGEMEKIVIPKMLLEKAGDEVIIRVEKAGA